MTDESNNRLYIYYLATAGVFLLLKLFHSVATTDQLLFLITPVAKLIDIITGTNSVYQIGNGFYNAALNIIIDKSCSGFNFGSLCFLLLNFQVFKFISAGRKRLMMFPTTLLIAYIATIFVNTSRILLAVLINKQVKINGIQSPEWLHLAQGTFVYLFFFILIYISVELTLKKTTR